MKGYLRIKKGIRLRAIYLLSKAIACTQKIGLREYQQLSDDETIDFLLKNKNVGIVRFGNSELSYIAGNDIKHQVQDERLRSKLVYILQNHSAIKSYRVGLPLDATILFGTSNRRIVESLWSSTPRHVVQIYAKNKYVYLSPFVFRLKNVVTEDKKKYINYLAALFDGRDVIYVGPSAGRNSQVWNKIVVKEFISIPEKNAFNIFDEIKLDVTRRSQKYTNPLVLIVAGITATALSSELNESGILAYDLGQMTRHIKETAE